MYTYNHIYILYFTCAALLVKFILVAIAVSTIRTLLKKINNKISSYDDLVFVHNTINLDMLLVWPVLTVVVTYLLPMVLLVSRHSIALQVFLNNMTLYFFGTIMLGIWSKVNESRLQKLPVDGVELENAYRNMLIDWKKRWFRLLPISAYTTKSEQTEHKVKEIANYTEM